MPAETAATEPTQETHMTTQPDLCRRGHQFTPDNTLTHHGRRSCRTCDRARKRDWQRKKRALDRGLPVPEPTLETPVLPRPGLRTHCPHGHEYTPENTYIRPVAGSRACRACRAEQSRKYTAAQRGGSDTTPPPDVLPLGWHRRSDTPAAREAAQLFAQATQWRAAS